MPESPLEELEKSWNAHKVAREQVEKGTGFIEWSQTLTGWHQAATEHADYLLSAAREAETLRRLDEWKSANSTRSVWIARCDAETYWEVELTEGTEKNTVKRSDRLADAISAALNEWDAAIDAARKGQE